ncbi:MAG: TraR/DksA C4-type zinc finger protein [Planctomycetota bacterium]|nr:TraR/DksA C4-type zinc finger protein [Planctomycetota bacterium]
MATPRKKSKTVVAKKGRVASKKKPAAKPKPAARPAAKKAKAATAPKPSKKPASKTPVSTKAAKKVPPAAPTEKPKKRAKPKLTAADRRWQASIRQALIERRDKMLNVVQSTQAQMAQRVGDHADVSDRASDGFEDELAAGLMAIEAAQLDDIEAAIRRIDDGVYGLCMNCEKPIPSTRLEVLPFARRCLNCESSTQRYGRPQQPAYYDSDDD